VLSFDCVIAEPERYQAGRDAALTTARLFAECGARVVVLADAMYERRMALAGRVLGERDGLREEASSTAAELLEQIAAESRGYIHLDSFGNRSADVDHRSWSAWIVP
jgi:hypothetical protein